MAIIIAGHKKRNVVQEAYMGKQKFIEQMVPLVQEIVDQIHETGMMGLPGLKLTSSPTNAKLEELICKQFGFKTTNLIWDTSDVPNAYTWGSSAILNPAPNLTPDNIRQVTNEGYYDKGHSFTATIVVMCGIVTRANLNAREVVAIILHEIGHCFDNTFMCAVVKTSQILYTYGLSDIYLFIRTMVQKPVNVVVNSVPILPHLINLKDILMAEVGTVIGPAASLLAILATISNPMTILDMICGVSMEVYADDFAASHGFGADLASALTKMGKPKNTSYIARTLDRIPVVRTMFDLYQAPTTILMALLDPHPAMDTRVREIKGKLTADYHSRVVPAHLKPEIKKQLDAIETIEKVRDNDNIDNQRIWTTFVTQFNKAITSVDKYQLFRI